MDKLLEIPAFDRCGEPNTRVLTRMDASVFEKTAGTLPPDVAEYLKELRPDPEKLYLLIVALGAADFWGSNVNGDAFFEKDLLGIQTPMEASRNPAPYTGVPLPRYKTFLCARIFKHHCNKDPENHFGKVAHASYDHPMHRVLLIVGVDKSRAPDIVADIEKNGSVVWSMGCKVPFDVCSCCKHKAKNVAEYCEHLKTAMNQTWANGHKVFAVNTMPRFFDISRVLIPADKTAMTLMKVAGAGQKFVPLGDDGTGCGAFSRSGLLVPSAVVAERVKVAQAKAAGEKAGEIKKEIPVGPAEDAADSVGSLTKEVARARKIAAGEPDLPAKLLRKLAEVPVCQALSSAAALGIVLKPAEFTRMLLTKMATKRPEREVLAFVDAGAVNHGLVELLAPFVPQRSALSPWIEEREAACAAAEKTAEGAIPEEFLGRYAEYRESLNRWDVEESKKTIVKLAHLLAENRTASAADLAQAFFGMSKAAKVGKGALLAGGVLAPVGLAYLASGHYQAKRLKGEQLNPAEELVADHHLPLAAAAGVAGGVGAHKLSKLLRK
ncbi:MAG: hypothetical protein ABFE07_29130 [Armatimonadia bacterium]